MGKDKDKEKSEKSKKKSKASKKSSGRSIKSSGGTVSCKSSKQQPTSAKSKPVSSKAKSKSGSNKKPLPASSLGQKSKKSSKSKSSDKKKEKSQKGKKDKKKTKKDKEKAKKSAKKQSKKSSSAGEDDTKKSPMDSKDEYSYASASDSDSRSEADEFESDDSESAEESGPPTKLEFTKPTINQIVKDKKEVAMCYSEEIGNSEFEALFDEIAELNNGVLTLHSSYGSIIKSLVAMHSRRAKKKMAKEGQGKQPVKVTFMTTISDITPKQAVQLEEELEDTQKYDLERFVNPLTRDDTFKMLFDEIEDLNQKTKRLRTEFFDEKTNFLADKYENQTDCKFDRKRFNHLRRWTKKLATVVDQISREYNDDLLNFFRMD